MQEPDAGITAPVPSVTEPLVVVTPTPPMHVVAAFAATTSPAGNVSTRSALSVAAVAVEFASVIVRVLDAPSATLAGEKALVMATCAMVPFRRNI